MFYNGDMQEWGEYDVSHINFLTAYDYKTQCVKCAENGEDNSQDNLHVYANKGGVNCFKCGFAIPSEATLLEDDGGRKVIVNRDLEKMKEKRLTKEEVDKIVSSTGADPKGWRKLQARHLKGLGIRFAYDGSGEPCEMLTGVTYTENGETEFVGFKSRIFPKDFSRQRGYVGSISDLIGYKKFKNHKRTLVIVEGEVDYASAYQMYQMDAERRDKTFELPAVVSVANGAQSLIKTFTDNDNNFAFFKQFERVVLAFDNDEAGRKVVDEFIECMPRDNLYRANLRHKDANEYLVKNAISDWVADTYWNVTPVSVGKIIGSGDWLLPAMEELQTPRLKLSAVYQGINDATRGGFPMGRYVILAGASSVGKTAHINTMIYDWVFQPEHKVGIVSLELSQGQYYIEMLSRHLGINVDDIQDNEQRANFLNNPEIVAAGHSLFRTETGEDRFYVVDDRDSDIEKIKEMCEDLVVKKGVTVAVLDPITDLTQRMDNTEQVLFNSWVKSFVKKHNVLLIGISHVKKGDKNYDKGDIPDEGDLIGSYSSASSAAAIFFFSRNKMAEDVVERNTTLISTPKIRWTGRTGIIDKIYFDHESRRMINYKDYLNGDHLKVKPECLVEDEQILEEESW